MALSSAQEFVRNSQLLKLKPDELAHHGVLGMHWGVRKPDSAARESRDDKHTRNTKRKLAVGTLGGSVAAKKIVTTAQKRAAQKRAATHPDHQDAHSLAKKPTRELSNADIKRITDRLQKEQNLKKLNPGSVDRGKKVVLGIVAAAGTAATIYNLVNSPAGKASVKHGAQIVKAILAKSA